MTCGVRGIVEQRVVAERDQRRVRLLARLGETLEVRGILNQEVRDDGHPLVVRGADGVLIERTLVDRSLGGRASVCVLCGSGARGDDDDRYGGETEVLWS